MRESEIIAVYMHIVNGKTLCICQAEHKKCGRRCETGTVRRDRFEGWRQTMRRDRYGR